MSTKLKPIPDPEDKNGKPNEFPEEMTMRELKTYEGNDVEHKKRVDPLPDLTNDRFRDKEKIGTKIGVTRMASMALDSIEAIDDDKDVHIGFTIGKKVFCGHIIQRVPNGSYTRIGDGESILLPKPPVIKDPKLDKNIFQFDKTRQMAIKVGKNKSTDWMIVVAGNGCVYLDYGSHAAFNMPIFIVEQNGEYYRVNRGNRVLLLGSGHHLLLYTREALILFIRQHTITHQKSMPLSLIQHSLKSNSLDSNEPLDEMADENQNVLKKIDSNTPDEPTVEEDSKQSVKEIKGLSDQKSEPSLSITAPTPEVAADTEEDGYGLYKRLALWIGLILILLLCLFLLYRFCWKPTEIKESPITGKSVPTHHHIRGKWCKVCNTLH